MINIFIMWLLFTTVIYVCKYVFTSDKALSPREMFGRVVWCSFVSCMFVTLFSLLNSVEG